MEILCIWTNSGKETQDDRGPDNVATFFSSDSLCLRFTSTTISPYSMEEVVSRRV